MQLQHLDVWMLLTHWHAVVSASVAKRKVPSIDTVVQLTGKIQQLPVFVAVQEALGSRENAILQDKVREWEEAQAFLSSPNNVLVRLQADLTEAIRVVRREKGLDAATSDTAIQHLCLENDGRVRLETTRTTIATTSRHRKLLEGQRVNAAPGLMRNQLKQQIQRDTRAIVKAVKEYNDLALVVQDHERGIFPQAS